MSTNVNNTTSQTPQSSSGSIWGTIGYSLLGLGIGYVVKKITESMTENDTTVNIVSTVATAAITHQVAKGITTINDMSDDLAKQPITLSRRDWDIIKKPGLKQEILDFKKGRGV